MAKPPVKEDFRSMSGMQKAAILLMSVSEENASRLFSMMGDEEIKDLSNAMANLGRVNNDTVERLFLEFSEQMSASGAVTGNFDTTEKLLVKALGKAKDKDYLARLGKFSLPRLYDLARASERRAKQLTAAAKKA